MAVHIDLTAFGHQKVINAAVVLEENVTAHQEAAIAAEGGDNVLGQT